LWDVDLTSGYHHELVPNWSRRPGTDRFLGLVNPGLGSALRRFRPDVVLSFGYAQASLLWLCLTTSLPLMIRGDSHALASPVQLRGLKARLRQRALLRATAHLSVGSANRSWLRDQGVADDRIFNATHSVDQVRLKAAASARPHAASDARSRFGIPEQATIASFFGKLESKKQPLELIAAFKRIKSPDIHLMVVGAGPLEAEARSRAADDPRIHFTGFVNQSEIPLLMMAVDLIVLPSLGPHETWGMVINEGQCLGKAVLVSDHVGCHPDLVITGTTGWVFPAGDSDRFEATLRDALSDRGRLQRYGANAEVHAVRFGFSETTAGLMTALSKIFPA